MKRVLPAIAALSCLAVAPFPRAGETLNLGGVAYRITAEPAGTGDREHPAFRLAPVDGFGSSMVIHRRGAALTRLETDGATFSFAPDVERGTRLCPVADLFGEAWRSLQWQAEGDRLTASSTTTAEAVAALTAYENSRSPLLVDPALAAKFSRGYIRFLTDPASPPAVLQHVCLSILKLPATLDGSEEDRRGHAFARACAYFFVRCPARAAEELQKSGGGERSEGLQSLMAALGMDSFEKLPAFTAGAWTVTPWKGLKPPAQAEYAFIERSFVAEAGSALRTFSFTRQKIATKTQHFLHSSDSGRERLVDAFGERRPSDEELANLVKAQLKEPPTERQDPSPADPALEGFEEAEGSASLHVSWSTGLAGHSLELRRPALAAAMVAGAGSKSPCSLSGLAPGTYIVRLRAPSGRVVRSGTVTLSPGVLREISLDSF